MTKKLTPHMTDLQARSIADEYVKELIEKVVANPILIDGLTREQIGQRVFNMIRSDIFLFVKAILSLGAEVGHVDTLEDERYLLKEGMEIGTAFNYCFLKKYRIRPETKELPKKED
ncbi:unnamed protein product [Nezara viridula]|uniref:Uncharacterized protein n=1 Tax=Nezara viridula TaxID=85310 RepID=A0A9P0GWL3_NEZVI|nr:unnamed protein product [Nezara viridula]